jgi:hypothetical protein
VIPSYDATESSGEALYIEVTELATSENGGTDIVSYEIQIDDGNTGDFVTVQGGDEGYTLETTVTITDGIE